MTLTRTILASMLAFTACAEADAVSASRADDDRSHAPTKDASPMPHMSRSGHDITPLSETQKAPLVAALTPEQREITQQSGTERPFCGTLLDNKKDGVYACVVCGLPLFTSEHKFTSGTGWPSFYSTVDPEHVARHEDRSHGMVRTEIACTRCSAHLGHVFSDGPPPTGERHCLNSAALVFLDSDEPAPDRSRPVETETAYFAGGCFWGIEHYFQLGPGVINAESGYMQGDDSITDYRSVCSGTTGHAEAVKVVFDPLSISYETLLEAFFLMHDPTQVDRQGPDVGTQYRSGIYTTSPEQESAARAAIETLNASDRHQRPIATEVETARTFHSAETYHQDYLDRTGRTCHVTNPWPVIAKKTAGASTGTEGD